MRLSNPLLYRLDVDRQALSYLKLDLTRWYTALFGYSCSLTDKGKISNLPPETLMLIKKGSESSCSFAIFSKVAIPLQACFRHRGPLERSGQSLRPE